MTENRTHPGNSSLYSTWEAFEDRSCIGNTARTMKQKAKDEGINERQEAEQIQQEKA